MDLQTASTETDAASALGTQIIAHVKALEDYVNGLSGCTRCLQRFRFIVIEKAARVRIHLDVPGGEFTVDKQNSANLPLAITEAFAAARDKLEEYVRKVRHDAKIEARSPDVRVTTIFPPDGYGVLETRDGSEIYFRSGSCADSRN